MRQKNVKKKTVSLLLAAAMIITSFPVFPKEAQAAGTSDHSLSVTAFATKNQLMSAFTPDENGSSSTTGKLAFGKNSTSAVQEWYILGKDNGVTGDNTVLFAAGPIATNQKFDKNYNSSDSNTVTKSYNADWGCVYTGNAPIVVNANHYGGSDVRAKLKEIAGSEQYFTTTEQGLMNETTVKTHDTKENVDYTTTDKLYALTAESSGSSYTTIKAGTDDQILLAMSTYWSSGSNFWLRVPYSGNSYGARVAIPGSYVYDYHVLNGGALVPAFNLNLSSVIFASAAKAASGNAETGTIADGTAMTLRLNGSDKTIGTVVYDETSGKITAQKDAGATGTVSLVVQGKDGTNDWYYSVQAGETTSVTKEQIQTVCGISGDISFADCKIWLETTIDNVAYAKMAIAATPVTITGSNQTLTYDVSAIDVSKYFSIDKNAGTPTYSLVTENGVTTGTGNLSGKELTVTKIGVFKVKLTTAAQGTYAAGEETITLTITAKSLTDSMVTIGSGPHYYTGSAVEPSVTVKDGNKTLVSGTDYTVSYGNNTDAGTATVTVTGKGNYSGTINENFTITAKSLTDSMVTIASGPHYYTGSAVEPVVTVKDGSKTLESGTDYSVSYENNINVGTATITVIGKGNYAGTINKNFTITSKSLTADMITIASDLHYYTGSAVEPTVTVKDGSKTLVSGTDYTVSYGNNTNAGTATVTVTGIGNYSGTINKNFTITSKSLIDSMVTIASNPHYYTGSAVTPDVTVKDGSKTLGSGADYTVSYANNTNVGTATITVTGKGNYAGTIEKTFEIILTDADKVAAAKEIVEKALEDYTATNGTTKQEIQELIDTALSKAGLSGVSVTVGDLEKQEATKSESGSISGNVSIVSDNDPSVTDSVAIDKTIDKLPITDADKVAAAKKVVEETLAGYIATNGTTKQEIQNLIDTALTNAGITDVTVTVGNLSKTDANSSAAGSVSGSISITKGSASDSAAISKTIEKLPKTETEKVADAKKVVEDTLVGITARNETTKDDIQRVIDAALKDAEITDVKVTVGELTKTAATTEAVGNISGSITIVSANDSGVTDGVTIDKTIARHEHIWKWVITKEATADEEGEMKKTCTCGEVTTENIPKTGTGGSGTVIVKVDENDNECKASLPNEGDVKRKISLTDAEKDSLLKDGKNVEIILRLKEDVDEKANVTQKTEIQNKMGTNTTLGAFLDIKLLKKVGDEVPTPITEAMGEIKVSFEIPEKLRNTDNTVTRTYQIMRNHDGVVDILNAEYDKVTHMLTFKTDKFSTYALVYRDTKAVTKPTETDSKPTGTGAENAEKEKETDAERVAKAKGIVEKVLSEMPVTNDTTKESIQKAIDDALIEAGISDVKVVVGDLIKNPAATGAEGSLTGVAVVSKGSVSDSVSISKTIPKLPEDDIIKPQQKKKNNITMMAGTKVSQTGKEISVSWGEIKEADGYYVYVAYCGEDFSTKPSKIVKSDSPTKVSIKKINGKKLNLKRNYKVYVAAYKTVDGKEVVIGKTLICHIVGKNNHAYTNVKQVKLAESEFILKAGKTAQINARTVFVDKKKKQLSDAHAREFRYRTDNKEVAAVSKQGKIKAAGKGSCSIYVYARNGYAKKITVKVE